jgi:hypothetical protein
VNRWRQRLADLSAGSAGSALAPQCSVQNVHNVQKPSTSSAFEHYGQIEQGAYSGEASNSHLSDRDDARGRVEPPAWVTVGYSEASPRVGNPEVPDKPLSLLDGRRLWRFSQSQACTPEWAAAIIDQAYRCGTVLVADGPELIVVERPSSRLPSETLCELCRCAGGIIYELLQRSRSRSGPLRKRR